MFTIFFNYLGPLVVDVLPQGQTITGKHYRDVVLTQLCREIRNQKPTVGTSKTRILHDNASSHKTGLIVAFLEQNNINTVSHPPYSPDLVPCDFWLFPKLKKSIAGKPFSRIQDMAKCVNSELRNIPQNEYRQSLNNWLMRMQCCIDANGVYVKGL